MPKIDTTPKALRPYLFYGLDLDWESHDNTTCECPFCGREGKFSVNAETGQWRCFVCSAGTERGGGNVYTFLRLLWDRSDAATNGETNRLAAERRLLYPETLTHWGVCQSIITKEWLVPGYNPDGKLVQLYRYCKDEKGRKVLKCAWEMHHAIMVPDTEDLRNLKDTVYVCEGPWDGMALWEVMRQTKRTEDGLEHTASELSSLLAGSSVIAVPGSSTFHESWASVLAGRKVVLMYDNDHPREHQGRTTMAGYDGMRRVTGVLSRAEQQPREVHYVRWNDKDSEEGFNSDLSDGYDVRDLLSEGTEITERIRSLEVLHGMVHPIPGDWVPSSSRKSTKGGSVEIGCLPCSDWKTLVNAWRKAMHWTEGLDAALSVMLASILSTKVVGDQLWVKIIGPPSCGKSVLCEALAVNKRYVYSKSTIRGFHSGYKTDRDGSEDNSLIPLIKDRTLVTKDGDTLIQSPNLQQILAEARDLYDCTSRTHYRHGVSRNYENIRMTWILCGTKSLRTIDVSELGERFLDCVIVDEMDADLEREIGWRVALRADRQAETMVDGTLDSQEGPEMTLAKQLTGGYIDHLRSHAGKLMSGTVSTEGSLRRCQLLAEFVSFMRTRQNVKSEARAQRELSFRLISQHVRLAKCLAAVRNKKTLEDGEVMNLVRRTAMDTARGRSLRVVQYLHAAGAVGTTVDLLATHCNETTERMRSLLRHLRDIGVVTAFKVMEKSGSGTRCRLTDRLRGLYEEVSQ